MTFIVGTNIVASRPPERRLTGTPHARANKGHNPPFKFFRICHPFSLRAAYQACQNENDKEAAYCSAWHNLSPICSCYDFVRSRSNVYFQLCLVPFEQCI